MFKQCVLQKKLPTGHKTTTTYLPVEFAVVEKVIKLKGKNDEWEDGWVVESVSTREFNSEYIEIMSGQYKMYRYRKSRNKYI